jgi:hypothetical protein
VERDVERLIERVMLLEVRPVAEPRHDDQVAGRRDRQELGHPLDDPEDERLPVRQCAGGIPHAEDGQHRRNRKQDAGRGRSRGAWHAAADPTV